MTALRQRGVGATVVARGRVVLGVLLAALMLLPCIVAIACIAGRPWLPVDDFASIDLHVRDVWSLHPPLTGLYSRPPWNHPGLVERDYRRDPNSSSRSATRGVAHC